MCSSLGNAQMAMQGFKLTDFNSQIPTSGLGQGVKVSLNAIVSPLLSLCASRPSLSHCGCRTETSVKIPVAKDMTCERWKREPPKRSGKCRERVRKRQEYMHFSICDITKHGHMRADEEKVRKRNPALGRTTRLPTLSEQSSVCAEDYTDYTSVHLHAARVPSMST